MHPHQAERLTEVLDRTGLDALIASREANVAYLTGFRGLGHARFETPQYAVFTRRGTGLVAASVEAPSIVDDRIDVDQVACFGGFPGVEPRDDERPDVDVKRIRDLVDSRAPDPAGALASLLDTLGVRRGAVGLDEGRVTPAAWQRIAAQLPGLTLRPAATSFLAARRVKSPWEIERLGRALRVVEEALNEVVATLEPGMTERDAAGRYQAEVVKRGADPVLAILATGTRTWIPLPVPTDRALRAHDLVRFDVGAVLDGYHATVARTAVAGEPDSRIEDAHAAVQAGLEAAIAAVGPGAAPSRVYAAAVEATQGAGLTGFTAGHVGHAIGLEPHEPPELAPGTETALEAGEILTIELRHLEMGRAGIHLRETVLVTTSGAHSLNRSSRRLIVLD